MSQYISKELCVEQHASLRHMALSHLDATYMAVAMLRCGRDAVTP